MVYISHSFLLSDFYCYGNKIGFSINYLEWLPVSSNFASLFSWKHFKSYRKFFWWELFECHNLLLMIRDSIAKYFNIFIEESWFCGEQTWKGFISLINAANYAALNPPSLVGSRPFSEVLGMSSSTFLLYVI